MNIRYLGHSCFAITSLSGISVVTDPYQKVGYSLPKGLTADIVTVSHGHFDHNYVEGVKTDRVISACGVHAANGVEIEGIGSYHDEKMGALRGENVIYKIKMDGYTVCHLGDLGEEYSASLVEKIGKVDILLLPVGGTYTIDAKRAREYVEGISPQAVIPMHYKPSDGALDITPAQPFLALCKEGYTHLQTGVLQVNERTKGVYYMERVK